MTAKVETIRRMQRIWETQVKPHVQDLMGKEGGQYAAMVLVAHACEHAYKAIRNPKKRHVMQEALESVLRLDDLLPAVSRNSSVKIDVAKHVGRVDAHKIRVFVVNPWKHEGILKGEKTELTNDPQRARSSSRVILSGFGEVRPLVGETVELEFNAHHFVTTLAWGIDAAYAMFLDESCPLQYKQLFSPAQCRSALCKECKKELRPCEQCEEELEMVGEKIRCMCDENSESIREAIRWIRYCENFCDDPAFPKCREDGHFLLSDACLFSSVCREINKVLTANRPEPVRRDGAIWYAAGTYTEDEIRAIMRPLREEIEKHQQANKPRGKRQLTELRGLGKEIWGGMDAQAYVNQMRDEWQ